MKLMTGLIVLVLVCAPALAAKAEPSPSAAPPLAALFHTDAPENCNVAYLPTLLSVTQDYGNPAGTLVVMGGVGTIGHRPTVEERNALMIEMLIRFNGLSLTSDDFIDENTGAFDCTNDKLLSLV